MSRVLSQSSVVASNFESYDHGIGAFNTLETVEECCGGTGGELFYVVDLDEYAERRYI